MVNISECSIARDVLVSKLKDELLGPGSENSLPDPEHEIITDYPEVRYSVGVLYPQKNVIAADNDEIPVVDESEEEDIDESLNNEQDESDTVVSNDDRYEGNIADDLQDDTLDEAVALSTQYRPSSMGMSFFVDTDVKYIKLNITFATYQKTEWKDCLIPYTGTMTDSDISNGSAGMYIRLEDGFLKLNCPFNRREARLIDNTSQIPDRGFVDAIYKLANQCGPKGFKRIPHEVIVNIKFTESTSVEIVGLDDVEYAKLVAMKHYAEHGLISVTVMLVNNNEGDYTGTNSIFQPSITISTALNPHLRYASYANRIISEADEEEQSLALLYMNKQQYASGHGTSVKWNINEIGLGEISTDILPVSTVPQMDFEYAFKNGKVDKKSLSMKYLSDLDNTERQVKLNSINQLICEYEEWVNGIRKKAEQLSEKYKSAADNHVKQCYESLKRMKNGLNLLETDVDVFNAFQLTNRAMFMQLIHRQMQNIDKYPEDTNTQNILLKLDYRTEDFQYEYRWRPFQLAFLLINLVSLSKSDHVERNLVDLIWFPTGGGKTEAYLGLTAFTIFYRRLTHLPESGGTAVIMRYTLRLLASQQFSRASTLICACEYIRTDCNLRRSKYPRYNLGEKPITIGLWIGGDHTPNKNCGNDDQKGALEYFNKLNKADVNSLKDHKDKYNKFQVLKCPWCGTKMVKDIAESGRDTIGEWGYWMRDSRHFRFHCPQDNCDFKRELPIQVVDEELYTNPPTLLFGTVDKFAMIAWKEEVGHFFASNSKNRTPELIIQDELHLISGPLGSMVGLYEAAIDALCSAKGIRPKIIASTATIRRAKDQCFNLYNRPVRQFPPPGLDASNSFFSKDADPDEKPGRLYLGVMPFGKTKAMMQVISITTLLQYVSMLPVDDKVKDQYWTLTAYFNSLRDLGKCSGLVDDDIKDFMKRLARRIATEKIIRYIATADELTSRVSTTRLNETLEKLEHIVYSKENVQKKLYASNVLLATNMISVGVDVARLNLMMVVGQPKLTSEYIQASSRIGRTYPGLVCILYDATKSRDRSHYEQFYPYHESFYRYVEPTSVTPFSKPARERAVHSVIIGLIRHMYGLSHDSDAQRFDKNTDYTQKIETYLINRLRSIRSNMDIQLADESDELLSEIKSFWDDWTHTKESAPVDSFYYGDRFMFARPRANQRRLIKPFASGTFDNAINTLTSMRNVDKSVASHILMWGEDLV